MIAAAKRVRLRAAEKALGAAIAAMKAAECGELLIRVAHVVLRDVEAQIEALADDEPTVLEERLRASLRVCRQGGAA
jgi:hypothetical protein